MTFLCSREERLNFIRAKYVDKRFAVKTCQSEREKMYELEEAVNRGDLQLLLQTFAENVDFSATLPSSVSKNDTFLSAMPLNVHFLENR